MKPELERWVRENSVPVKEEASFTLHQVNTKLKHEDRENKVRVLAIGPENNIEVKTVLLLGETGAGKTHFLNTFLNRLFGVKQEDKIRLQLYDQMDRSDKNCTQSQTDYTTAYTIYHQQGMTQPFNYMIIDTPGLGDTEGQEKDKFNENCLRFYLTDEKWISHLNSVGLVLKGTEHRYDESKKEIFSKIRQLLGFDVKPLTDILLTFTANQDTDSIEVVKASGIEYNQVFFFENSPLYRNATQKSKQKQLSNLMWENMEENHNAFLESLNGRRPVELKITAKLILAQMKLESLSAKQEALRQRGTEMSEKIRLNEGEMSLLDEEATRVDWDKVKDLDTSTTEIVLDDGRHCHYCKRCDRTCIASCTSDHSILVSPMAAPSNKEASNVGKDVLDIVDNVATLGMTFGLMNPFVGAVSGVVSAIAKIGRSIFGLIGTSKSKAKTDKLHRNEGSNRCPKCSHFMSEHEVRDKIMAKDADFDQRIKLLKEMKFKEVMGKKAEIQGRMEASAQELDAINKRMEQENMQQKNYEKEIGFLRRGY